MIWKTSFEHTIFHLSLLISWCILKLDLQVKVILKSRSLNVKVMSMSIYKGQMAKKNLYFFSCPRLTDFVIRVLDGKTFMEDLSIIPLLQICCCFVILCLILKMASVISIKIINGDNELMSGVGLRK